MNSIPLFDINETPEQRAKRMGVPYFPVRQMPANPFTDIVGVCGGCGRNVHRVEGYSCPHAHCPIQMVITC